MLSSWPHSLVSIDIFRTRHVMGMKHRCFHYIRLCNAVIRVYLSYFLFQVKIYRYRINLKGWFSGFHAPNFIIYQKPPSLRSCKWPVLILDALTLSGSGWGHQDPDHAVRPFWPFWGPNAYTFWLFLTIPIHHFRTIKNVGKTKYLRGQNKIRKFLRWSGSWGPPNP